MTIPDYQTAMLPLLNLAADGEEHSLRDTIEELADHFHLSDEERKQLLPSGTQATFDNRVGWARTYMKKAGLLQDPKRGHFKITDRGIEEDRLGLEVVYLQAKRWQNIVQRPEIQKFVGALSGQNARKGVFITTSNFSTGARQYADALSVKVVLIDGETLANLMIEHDVGVAPVASYEIKRADSDYFDEA